MPKIKLIFLNSNIIFFVFLKFKSLIISKFSLNLNVNGLKINYQILNFKYIIHKIINHRTNF